MQNDPRSHGLWEISAPAAPVTGPLQGDLTVDVAIVGAGYTGLSAALHLAQAGRSVAVVEAVDVGFGGAGRNVGLVNAGMWVMPEVLLETLGPVYGPRLLDALGNGPARVFDLIARHGIACEATQTGTLHCAVGAQGLAEINARAAQWQARGADVRVLGAAEAAAKLGTTAYAGALLDNRAGTIQPLAYARGLATAALGAGAQVFTASPVSGIDRAGDAWRVQTAQGSLTAPWVIMATDAYTHTVQEGIRAEQVHLPYFNFATVPLSSNLAQSVLPERQGAWDTRDVLTSFRMDQAGRLILGSVGALGGVAAGIHRDWARRTLARLFPQLGEVAFESEWFGKIGMTSDNLPRIHRFGHQMLGASGFNGRGISPGTVFGAHLADHILGRIDEADMLLPVSDMALPPFRRVKEAFYELGAQVVHLTDARL
ncbi:MAG: FAD-binding oxidoreductase [Pseudomonadota bacterium]